MRDLFTGPGSIRAFLADLVGALLIVIGLPVALSFLSLLF